MLDSEYPYTSGSKDAHSTKCQYSASKATNVKVKYIGVLHDTAGFHYTIDKSPRFIAIAANNKYIHSYASGVIDASDCYAGWNSDRRRDNDPLNPVNHGVLAVGYGIDQATGLNYILVKNSWNTTWGDKGYFKVKWTGGFTISCSFNNGIPFEYIELD